ncbi:MAG: rhomboid family intramembrane serine protease [Deltaproteobacteria bacterium]|jgi:membrane associated rhomboid family serine protease|nr:rhomboid family intramembrane serine protease [Deltaproteobacteria bacterium]
MIPLRDINPSRNFPVVNTLLIGINVAVFLLQMSKGNEIDRFVYTYGLVPARYSISHVSSYFTPFQQVFSFVSFMFLHGGFLHILGNMWSLYIFGDNVEDRLGPFRYLVFYLLCGLASGVSHLVLNMNSTIPTIGASGAIAGVMGAYLVLHPRSRILTLIPILIFPWFVEIPAFFFIGFWFVLQLLNAAGSHGGGGGIAWWAHIGGFLFGIIFLKLSLMLPSTGVSKKISPMTTRKKTSRIQIIRPGGPANDPNLYGTLVISPSEARLGSSKLVNIPWGFQKRLIKVKIPSNIKEGNQLKLKSLGKLTPEGGRGDLFLKVRIK